MAGLSRTKAVEDVLPTIFPCIFSLCQNPHRRAPCPYLVPVCVARIRLPNHIIPYNFNLSVDQSQAVFYNPRIVFDPNNVSSRDHVTQMRRADWPSAQRQLPVGVVYRVGRQVGILIRRVLSTVTIVLSAKINPNCA